MLSKQKIIVLVVLVLFLGTMGYGVHLFNRANDARDSDAAKILGGEESTQYQSLSGETVTLDTYDGSVRVVNSWASWSPFSQQELQDLNRLAQAYSGQNVAVIAINRNEDRIRAQNFLQQVGELPAIHILIDGDDTFYDRMEGQAMPETLFFDRKGTVVSHARGQQTYDEMVANVEAALAAQ